MYACIVAWYYIITGMYEWRYVNEGKTVLKYMWSNAANMITSNDKMKCLKMNIILYLCFEYLSGMIWRVDIVCTTVVDVGINF